MFRFICGSFVFSASGAINYVVDDGVVIISFNVRCKEVVKLLNVEVVFICVKSVDAFEVIKKRLFEVPIKFGDIFTGNHSRIK